ncbi:DUF7240 domain-containing protein [Mycolicibacterium goodii]|uniref:DUF7240 domain-containing protein n=1 Tax=Mycolicibacterium goodii TaxID=134601 RepID=UPI000232F4FA|nr:hypothetical protein [Mycolicibacterium goodii]YP_009013585.1 hypothetical protein DORI_35 [Mycobacterium phage Dori]AER47685.1 hypothetical protein DORI_35 [Mycobacterium phage Dori]
MWEPPPGFEDMLGDAALVPPIVNYVPLEVPDVGTVHARRPGPAAVPLLAMSVNPQLHEDDDQLLIEQQKYATRFVREHLRPGEHERVLASMVEGDATPGTPIGHIARALATWGTARPYIAVMTLSLVAATHWRPLRTRLRSAGIADPMRDLPSMHDVLDEAEKLWLESLHTGDAGKDKHETEKLFDQLYAPDSAAAKRVNAKGYKGSVRPAGFSKKEVAADFKAAARMLGAR